MYTRIELIYLSARDLIKLFSKLIAVFFDTMYFFSNTMVFCIHIVLYIYIVGPNIGRFAPDTRAAVFLREVQEEVQANKMHNDKFG